jgi:ribosomal protein S27E
MFVMGLIEIIFLRKPLFEVIGSYDDMEVPLESAVKELKEGSSKPMLNHQVFDDVHCEDCVNDSVCYIDRDFISAVNCHVDRDFVRVDNELKYETDHFCGKWRSIIKSVENRHGAIPKVKSNWRGVFNSEKSIGKLQY